MPFLWGSMLEEVLQRVSVLGAGGKMGSGIALLLLQEMALLEAESTEDIGSGNFRLVLIDVNDAALNALSITMKNHLVRYAERHINRLRRCFYSKSHLIGNAEIIQYFVDGALRIVRFETDWLAAKNSHLVIEAIVENLEIKTDVLSEIAGQASSEIIFFTNTSSIPIHLLNEKAHLHNRLIGFHFYNPPLIQKLIELIVPDQADPKAASLAKELANKLDKTVVVSRDVAGFIGNGYFIREAMYAAKQVSELSRNYSHPCSIYMINRVTQEFLIRPMGIFQLIDYVGIDIFDSICQIMSAHISNELFQDPLFDKMINLGILGGQNSDGSQKNGFFQYENSMKSGIYSISDEKYIPLSTPWSSDCDDVLGKFPKGHASWNKLKKDPAPLDKLKNYFFEMAQDHTTGSELARQYLTHSKNIAKKLVHTRVANSVEDVDAILKLGFYHLYGLQDVELSVNLRC